MRWYDRLRNQQRCQLMEKFCNTCKQTKATSEFYKASRERDGLQSKCKQCTKEYAKNYRASNVEKEKQRHAKYHQENKDAINARTSQWQKNNPEKRRAKSRRHRKNNLEKERERLRNLYWRKRDDRLERSRIWRLENIDYAREYDRRYLRENPGKFNAKNAKRRAKIKQAIPAWADESAIAKFYEEAQRLTRETGIEHHVDHVIPLTSKLVCGLHVEFNLQILTESENLRKNNKFNPLDYASY